MSLVEPNMLGLSTLGSTGEREMLGCISEGCNERENFIHPCH